MNPIDLARLTAKVCNGAPKRLTGKHNQELRRQLLAAMHDSVFPLKECGITRLEQDFFEFYSIPQNCLALRRKDLQQKILSLAATPPMVTNF